MPEDTRPYQDDIDTSDERKDPLMNELNDDPTEELQVPPEEFGDELDTLGESSDDDMREMIEDRDERDDNAASNP